MMTVHIELMLFDVDQAQKEWRKERKRQREVSSMYHFAATKQEVGPLYAVIRARQFLVELIRK